MENSILSEVDDTSILRTAPPTRYRPRPATGPSAQAPRSGLERSDFVHWPVSTVRGSAAIRPQLGVKRTRHEHHETDANDPQRTSPSVLRRKSQLSLLT